MSRFGSHIRYGILIGFGVAVCYEITTRFTKYKWVFLSVALWFAIYTYYSQVLSGIISLSIIVIGILGWMLYRKSKFIPLGALGLSILLLFLTVIFYVNQPIESKSAFPENYITLKMEWNKRAKIPYDSLDLRNQHLSQTLERYLISKNLPVRGDGVKKLSDLDINYIQKGFADIHETKPGMMARLFGVRYEIQHNLNPNGHSILERIEYWKNASAIIRENWLFGVGTGDINDEIQKMYKKRHSALNEDRRLRAHNSYLTFWTTFGFFGLIYFVLIQWTFFKKQLKVRNILGVFFMLIASVTFLFEDTLETQMGITFFTLFYSLFSNEENRNLTD
jgi:O-antigen ligase